VTGEMSAAQARQAAAGLAQAVAGRNWAIADMRAEGATLRQIADTAGLTHTGVRKILARVSRPTALRTGGSGH